jgi:hypothetical protein
MPTTFEVNKLIKILDTFVAKELLPIGKRVDMDHPAVKYYYNKKEQDYYLNKKKLIKVIKKAYKNGHQSIIEEMIMEVMDSRIYGSVINEEIAYKDKKLYIKKTIYYNSFDKDIMMEIDLEINQTRNKKMKIKFSNTLSRKERNFYTWYFEKNINSQFGPVEKEEKNEILFSFLEKYWEREREYVYHEYRKVSHEMYYIKIHVKGMEKNIINVYYLPATNEIKTIHMNEFYHIENLFHIDGINEFIRKKAPCRLEFLYN